jgi:deoxyribonuclease-2
MEITGLKAVGDDGKPVDWFFIYKLPAGASDPTGASGKRSTGTEYMYFDSRSSSPLALSQHAITDKSSALQKTLAQIYKTDAASGFILYNDEPPTGKMDGRYGHTKGVLAYDTRTDTAFWLLHSTPKFPTTEDSAFPDSGVGNGQSFLCISLESLATAEKLATVLRVQQQPQIYASVLPKTLHKNSPLRLLVSGVNLKAEDPPATFLFSSHGGQHFRLFAKNRHWGGDLWRELVAEKLEVDLEVETWRRLELDRDASGSKESDTGKEDVEDVRYINLEHIGIPFEWYYTKDHSKLGTSKEYDWVIVADINRDKSQGTRGGGAVVFQNQSLWDSLTRVEVIYDATMDQEYQKRLAKRKGKEATPTRTIKMRGKSGGARVSVDLDADQVANLEKIARVRKTKTLGETIKRLIRETT